MSELQNPTEQEPQKDPFSQRMGCGFFFVLLLTVSSALIVSLFFFDVIGGMIPALFFFATLGLLLAAIAGMKVFKIPPEPLFGSFGKIASNLNYLGLTIVIIFCSMGIFLAKIILVYLIAPDWVSDFANRSDVMDFDFGETMMGNGVLFLAVVIIGPIAEEILFRGILFTRWSRVYGPARAAFYSSLLFGVLHANALGLFFAGWVLCMVYMYTRSLWVPIAMHILNNLFAVLFYHFELFDMGLIDASNISENLLPALGIVAITLSLVFFLIQRLSPARQYPMPFDANRFENTQPDGT